MQRRDFLTKAGAVVSAATVGMFSSKAAAEYLAPKGDMVTVGRSYHAIGIRMPNFSCVQEIDDLFSVQSQGSDAGITDWIVSMWIQGGSELKARTGDFKLQPYLEVIYDCDLGYDINKELAEGGNGRKLLDALQNWRDGYGIKVPHTVHIFSSTDIHLQRDGAIKNGRQQLEIAKAEFLGQTNDAVKRQKRYDDIERMREYITKARKEADIQQMFKNGRPTPGTSNPSSKPVVRDEYFIERDRQARAAAEELKRLTGNGPSDGSRIQVFNDLFDESEVSGINLGLYDNNGLAPSKLPSPEVVRMYPLPERIGPAPRLKPMFDFT